MHDKAQIIELENDWATNPRWVGVTRKYPASEVVRLRGSIQLHYTLAEMGATRLWHLLHTEPFIRALGALTGNQAVEMVSAGLQAIYLSGWQVAGDANDALQMYPDQSLYPVSSVPNVIKRLNNALVRADQIQHMQGKNDMYWFAPIVADAEAGFRRAVEYVRVDQGHDRSGRGGGASGRSIIVVEEVRAHGRQGAGDGARIRAEVDRGAAGGRCAGRADAHRGAHRFAGREFDPRDQRSGR